MEKLCKIDKFTQCYETFGSLLMNKLEYFSITNDVAYGEVL
jgi:hypothetical protein